MRRRLDLPVVAENDANLGAVAEAAFGAARTAQDVLYIKLTSGIGAGVIVKGGLYRGTAGRAGEIGHVIVDPDGPLCRCGNRGCLEMLVGVPALLETVRPVLGDITLGELLDLAVAGHAGCRRVLADAGAIQTPTLMLGAGRDWVVSLKAQQEFFARLSSPIKEMETYPDDYHAIFHEQDRHRIVDRVRKFIDERFAERIATPSLLQADRAGHTWNEY